MVVCSTRISMYKNRAYLRAVLHTTFRTMVVFSCVGNDNALLLYCQFWWNHLKRNISRWRKVNSGFISGSPAAKVKQEGVMTVLCGSENHVRFAENVVSAFWCWPLVNASSIYRKPVCFEFYSSSYSICKTAFKHNFQHSSKQLPRQWWRAQGCKTLVNTSRVL